MSDLIRINTAEAAEFGGGGIKTVDILELVSENDPILYETTDHFDFENPPTDPVKLASELVDTCKAKGGFGLAAPQCGQPYRVFVMGAEEEYVAFFNPEILSSSDEKSLIAEGCLSFPMLALKIERSDQIEVRYQDYTGNTHTGYFSGLSAHCYQHELDHLNGICYTSRAKPMALKMGHKKRDKYNTLVDRYNKAQAKKEKAISLKV